MKKIIIDLKETNYYIDSKGNFYNEERQLKTHKIKNGYVIAQLNVEGKKKNIYVHRLVCEAFLDTWDENLQVNHKDFDKTNNCVENLEMVTRLENYKHLWDNRRDEMITKLKNGKMFLETKTYEIIKKSYDGEFISKYNNIFEAVEIESCNIGTLRRKCNKTYKICCYGNKDDGYFLYNLDGSLIIKTERLKDIKNYIIENGIKYNVNSIKQYKPKTFFEDRFYYGEKTL